jgi:hypothetical protein
MGVLVLGLSKGENGGKLNGGIAGRMARMEGEMEPLGY